MGNYSLNNLTIFLQASILNNNVWGPVINLTNNGVTLNYYSDGNYIYFVYEPTLSLTYDNTILEELTLSGNVIKSLNIPKVLGIKDSNNGFVGNSLYQFYNRVLSIK